MKKIEEKLTSLGGKVKNGKIYITGIWKKLLNAKVEYKHLTHVTPTVCSLQINGNELLKYGTNPINNGRKFARVNTFIKAMHYAYYDVETGKFRGIPKGFEKYFIFD